MTPIVNEAELATAVLEVNLLAAEGGQLLDELEHSPTLKGIALAALDQPKENLGELLMSVLVLGVMIGMQFETEALYEMAADFDSQQRQREAADQARDAMTGKVN